MKKYSVQPLLCLVFTVVFIVSFHIVGQAHDVSMDAGAGFTSFNHPPDKTFVSYAGVTAALDGDTMSGYQVYAPFT